MEIIFSNAAILAVNKPAGLPIIPGGWEIGEGSVWKSMEAEYGRLWVVHRLDKGTSGLVVFARDAQSHKELSNLFEHHKVEKVYHAIFNGVPAWQEHTARHPLRANVGHSHRTVVDNSGGKSSQTFFKVVERFRRQALMEAHPGSGRTHQVRVHAYALGFPLLGDRLYGQEETNLINRPALHAWSLEFIFEDKPYKLHAPYPEDFSELLKIFRSGN